MAYGPYGMEGDVARGGEIEAPAAVCALFPFEMAMLAMTHAAMPVQATVLSRGPATAGKAVGRGSVTTVRKLVDDFLRHPWAGHEPVASGSFEGLTRLLRTVWPRLAPILNLLFTSLESKFSVVNWRADPRRACTGAEMMKALAILACNGHIT